MKKTDMSCSLTAEAHDTYMICISNIRKIREEKKITQGDLAHICGFSDNYISALERNAKNASCESFISIAHALQVPLSVLAGEKLDGILPELLWEVTSLDLEEQKKLLRIMRVVFDKK